MTTLPEPGALDTNVLVYALFQDSPFHAASRTLLESAQSADAGLFVTAQSLAEFFAVVTNPRRVTSPRTCAEAIACIERMLAFPGLRVLAQPTDIVARWCQLLRQRPVTGADVFDVQIIATMLANGITRIYTYNVADFQPFLQIQVIKPS